METYIIFEILSNNACREVALAEVEQEGDMVKIIKKLYNTAKWQARKNSKYEGVIYDYDSFEDCEDWL